MSDTMISWGVLSTAKIGRDHVIPAIQRASGSKVVAIASRDKDRAEQVASSLSIPKSYGSYDKLLEDPQIDAVYIPLPNHMHVPWIKRAARAGKHVLCEKPIALAAGEVEELIEVQKECGVLIGEAFMVLHHPRWKRVRQLLLDGYIGQVSHIDGFFSFNNTDPANIRNIKEYGGGSLYDIGVYPTVISRFLLGQEPEAVCAMNLEDPGFQVDAKSSVMLRFPAGKSASFTCSMQIAAYQQIRVFGSEKVLIIDIPFNTPKDRDMAIRIQEGIYPENDLVLEHIDSCDQYTLQAEAFTEAISGKSRFAGDLDHALNQMRAIEAMYESAKRGSWIEL